MNRATLIAAVLLTLSVPSFAEVEGEELRAVVAPGGVASADYDAMVLSAVSFIERHPESSFVPAALLRIGLARGYALDESPATDRLLAVFDGGVASERNQELLRRYLRDRLRESGRFQEAGALEAWRYGYLRDWAVVGPFGAGATSELDRRFEPETVLDRGKTYYDGIEERRFVEVPPGDNEWIRPGSVLPRGTGTIFALHDLDRESAGIGRLRVRCRGSFRLWVNGEELLRVDRLRERLGPDFSVDVAFQKGRNAILLKLAPDANRFAVRRLATDDAPRAPDEDDPWRMAARAMTLDRDGLDLEAVDLMEKVGAALPDDAGILFLFGQIVENARGLPEVHRKNRAKGAYRGVLERVPGHVPAAVRLAALKHADDKSEEAVGELRTLLSEHPDCLLVRQQLGRILQDRGWEKEALAAAKECLKIAPRFRAARFMLINHYERKGNIPEARKHLEAALATNQVDTEAIRKLASHDAEAGDVEKVVARYRRMLEVWPNWWSARLWLADLLENEGRTDEAVAMLRALADRYPLDPRFPNLIGKLYRKKGDIAAAIALFERELELEPGRSGIRRYLTRLKGEEEDFSLPYEVDVLDLIPEAPGREEFPRSPAVALLDSMVTRVWPDGSSSNVIHMAYKILDEKGVEKFGTVETNGETLEVRTIDPQGRIFEPIGVHSNSYNMPALAPGAVVEYRFRFDTGARRRMFDTVEFYFADPEFDNAVLLSRWVVILPKDLDCELVERNFESKHTTTVEGDTIVHVFEVKDSARTEREPRMPPNSDLLPWVRFHRNPPFDDAAFQHLDRRWRGIPVAPLVRKEAEKVLEGVEGNLARVEALFSHVNDLVTGRGSYGGPTATLIEKAGDRFQLLASLMVAAEIPFEFGAACTNRGRDVDWQFAPADGFRTACMRIEGESGAPVWVFGGSRFAPFGRIPDSHRGSPVLVLSKVGGRIETLPEGLDEEHQVRTFARIDLTGEMPLADLRLSMASDGGYSYRESIFNCDADDRRQSVEGWISGLHTAAKIISFDFPDLEKLGADPVMSAKVEAPNYLRKEGKEVTAGPGVRPLNLAEAYVGKPTRIHPMVLREDYAVEDRAEIHIGDGFRVTSLPRDHVAMGPIGAYSLTYRERDGVIHVRRAMRYRPVTLTPDEYRELVLWVKAVDQAEARRIRLARN